jgi:hypothetical protein
LIALLEGMLTTNRTPDLFISYKVYGLVKEFTKMAGRPSLRRGIHNEGGFQRHAIRNEGDPADSAKKRAARFLELKQNERNGRKPLPASSAGYSTIAT